MKLLRNSVATLCYSLLLTAAPVFAVEYALPAANSRLVGENLEYVVPAKRTASRWRPLRRNSSWGSPT